MKVIPYIFCIILFYSCSDKKCNDKNLPFANTKKKGLIFNYDSCSSTKEIGNHLFYKYLLVADSDTLDGYWGVRSDTLYFVNSYDLLCERIIPITYFKRSFKGRYFFGEETCIHSYIYGLDIISNVVDSTDNEIITEVSHKAFDPTIKIVLEIPPEELDSMELLHSINTEVAVFKISSVRGVIGFRREIYGDSTVFLPY